MKKKIAISVIIIILLICCIPTRTYYLKDGGTVEYKSILYKISKVHSLKPVEIENPNAKMYNEGIIIEVLGFEIYNHVK